MVRRTNRTTFAKLLLFVVETNTRMRAVRVDTRTVSRHRLQCGHDALGRSFRAWRLLRDRLKLIERGSRFVGHRLGIERDRRTGNAAQFDG